METINELFLHLKDIPFDKLNIGGIAVSRAGMTDNQKTWAGWIASVDVFSFKTLSGVLHSLPRMPGVRSALSEHGKTVNLTYPSGCELQVHFEGKSGVYSSEDAMNIFLFWLHHCCTPWQVGSIHTPPFIPPIHFGGRSYQPNTQNNSNGHVDPQE